MPSPAPGNYYTISRGSMASSDSDPLAINFTGVLTPLNVTRLENSLTQVWVVSEWKDKRVLSPKVAPKNHVGMGKYFTDVWVINQRPDPPSCWYINECGPEAFTIQNGNLTGFWGLKKVVHGETVSFGAGTGDVNDNWLLLPAGDCD